MKNRIPLALVVLIASLALGGCTSTGTLTPGGQAALNGLSAGSGAVSTIAGSFPDSQLATQIAQIAGEVHTISTGLATSSQQTQAAIATVGQQTQATSTQTAVAAGKADTTLQTIQGVASAVQGNTPGAGTIGAIVGAAVVVYGGISKLAGEISKYRATQQALATPAPSQVAAPSVSPTAAELAANPLNRQPIR
jgi:hypothetical protein